MDKIKFTHNNSPAFEFLKDQNVHLKKKKLYEKLNKRVEFSSIKQ